MTQTNPSLRLCDTHEVPLASLTDFAAQCASKLQAGERLVTLFGRPDTSHEQNGICTTAVFQSAPGMPGALSAVRGLAIAGQGYTALTSCYPAAQSHERELWEQTGIIPEGHPWLKPMRFEGARQQHMGDYPFFGVRGQEVHEVGVGPIHASVIEPGHFRFMCLGEQVHHLEIQLGYQHRDVESMLLRRPPTSLTPLVESICGDSAVAYAWGHCAAIEALAGISTGLELDLLRGMALELERIAMHVACLSGLATDIAFLQGGGTYGRLRTAIINATQRICGNRFGRGWLRPGSARGLDPRQRSELAQTLNDFSKDFAQINTLMVSSLSVAARFKRVGVISTTVAQELGLCGLVARASGVATDARAQLPGRLYEAYPLPTVTEEGGDCWARMHIRMREVEASVQWLQGLLKEPTLEFAKRLARPADTTPALRPNSLCISLIEGARGPVLQVLETDTQGELLHYKVQDPSLANWFGLAMAVRENAISDFPICNKSFDLSYCGNDL
jgi:Ni,Fe-hydrogenase III large subunit/Ni,Fe-hydrogenase III component G